jgi:hypothetical protein
MFRLIRQSSLVLAATAGLALLAIAGVAVARSVHLGAPSARTSAQSTQVKPKPATKPKAPHKAKQKAKPKRKTHKQPAAQSRYAVAADRICSSNRSTVRQIGAAATNWTLQQSELHDLAQATNGSVSKLQALSPPKNAALARRYTLLTKASIQDFLSAQQRSSSANEAVGVATERQDTAAAETSGREALAAQTAARKLGMRVCGSSGAEWL